MKRIVGVAVLLIMIGVTIAAYSYTRLRGQDVLFDQTSIQLDGHTYLGYEMIVNLDGKFAPRIIGGVWGVGSSVDFYLVNDTSWNLWSTNPELRSSLSTVHLNATVGQFSSTMEGHFSFVPSKSMDYSVVFVNDKYPDTNDASVNATITLQYIYLNSLYSLVAGLIMLGISFLLLIVTVLMKAQQ